MKKLKLMADYQCFPLWETEGEVGNLDLRSLPISLELKNRLLDWARAFDKTFDENYPPNPGFKSLKEEKAFQEEGALLINFLRIELGNEYNVDLKI